MHINKYSGKQSPKSVGFVQCTCHAKIISRIVDVTIKAVYNVNIIWLYTILSPKSLTVEEVTKNVPKLLFN